MNIAKHSRLSMGIMVLILMVALTACGNNQIVLPSPTTLPVPTTVVPTLVPATPTAAGIWETLLVATPFPFEFPLPEGNQSPIDGLYGKVDQSPPQWWTCLRCADYRPAGGIWRMQFEKGVMRIYYEMTNWKSIASFTVSGNQLKIFNDPICPHDVGEYEWQLENGNLVLNAINDSSCAFDLRKKNLINQPWIACNTEGKGSPSCQEIPAPPAGQTPAQLPVMVTEQGGDSHYFGKPPDIFAAANSADVPSPNGIQLAYPDASIGYGTYRVLWENGDWIESTTELPFTSIGVQFWGPRHTGWARVIFDGTEVWRGLTSALGSKFQYYGGYIEISNFKPGKHTIRVESLEFDFHPVVVAAFGFANQSVQK